MIEPRLSVKQLAATWGCSRQHIYTLVDSGRLGCFRLGGMLRFRPEDVQAYEAACRAQNQTGRPTPSPSAATPEAPTTFNGGKAPEHAGYHAALRTRAKRAA